MRGEMAISPLSLIIFGDYEGRNAHFSPHDLKNYKQQQIITKKILNLLMPLLMNKSKF